MTDESNLHSAARLAGAFMFVGVGLLILAVAGLAWASFAPLNHGEETTRAVADERVSKMPDTSVELKDLLWKMAGNYLIRPAQVTAAVKDSGAAASLAKKLKLEGIVEMGGELCAYIRINKSSRKVVVNDTILEFVVAKIEPGKVTLDLDGVRVKLEH